MKSKLYPILLISVFLTCTSVQAKPKVLLSLNLQKGSVYEMTMETSSVIDQELQNKKMKIDQKMTMVFSYKVLDIMPNKSFLIEYNILNMRMNLNTNSHEMNFDSESSDENNPLNSSIKGIESVKVKFELTSAGQVERVEGLEEYARKFAGNEQMTQTMQMLINEKSFVSFVSQTFNYFTEKKVKMGSKWTITLNPAALMNLATTLNFEVADIDKENVHLNLTSDVNIDSPVEQAGMKFGMKASGTQIGSMTIDRKDGWIRVSDLTQKFDILLVMKNPQTGEDMNIPMAVNSVQKLSVKKM